MSARPSSFLFRVGLRGYTGNIGFLLSRKPRGVDRVADHVGGTLFTFGASRPGYPCNSC